jgi:protein-L-isoaspartate O-methyltransferase
MKQVLVLVGIVGAVSLVAQSRRVERLAPYYATPEPIVERMLRLAQLKAGEKMFDLGSGDGRIVVLAAKKYQADATGVEIDSALVQRSLKRIQVLGLASSARIVQGDLLAQDYSSADLLTIYLLPFANDKLRPMLEKQLKPGARVVSHNSEFRNWKPVQIERIEDDGQGRSHVLFLYQR